MLTPDFLNYLEFNDVVKIYEQLNIDITADIITRIAQGEEITEVSRKQLQILKETSGAEIFNEALKKTSLLTSQTKEALKKTFETMAKEDIQGYKELYEYRNKPFKLSENQYKKLNQGLKQTNRLLRNFTNTIAFQSKQAYVETIDKAYMKVTSGAFDYTSAINSAVDELARKGITLKDKAGRNVQLEVAVRRNVMAGLTETASELNRDIEEELGCDGYEVPAHTGARPSHAAAQGKQYAIKKEDSKKYGVGLWKDVEDLWEEYGCRHKGGIFGIILGISEPQYTKKELAEMENATVTYKNKEIPYYEATQKQRQLENEIRKQKRTVEILDKANKDSTEERNHLRKMQQSYIEFCDETGLEKDYSRMRVAKSKVTNKNKNSIIKEQMVKAGSLEEALGKEHTQNIVDTIKKAPEYIKKVWNNFIDKVNINDINYKGTAHYSWKENGTYIDLEKISKDRFVELIRGREIAEKAYSTLYHETGHHISAIYSKSKGQSKCVSAWFESKKYFKEQFAKDGSKVKIGMTLDEMIRKEGGEYLDKVLMELRAEAKSKGLKATTINATQVYQKISKDLYNMSIIEQCDISDMFDGITNGKVHGFNTHSKQDKKYWRTHSVGSEGFAEMTDATINNLESLERIKEYFPKSYEIYQEIIKEMEE